MVNRTTRIPLKKKLLFLAILLAVSLGVVEGLVRLAWPQHLNVAFQPSEIYYYDDVLGKRLIPGYRGVHHLQDFRVSVAINAHGYRDRDHDPLAAGPKIYLIGDSFTFGHGVEREDAFGARLDERLGNVEVFNLALAGSGPVRHRRLLQSLYERGSLPDLVVVGWFPGNDVYDDFRFEDNRRANASKTDSRGVIVSDTGWHGVKHWLTTRSHAYYLVSNTLKRIPALRRTLESVGAAQERQVVEESPETLGIFKTTPTDLATRSWPVALETMAGLLEEARSRGIPVLVVSIPVRFTVEDDRWARIVDHYALDPDQYDFDLPARKMEACCRRHGADFFDLRPGFREALEEPGPSLYFEHDGHWTSRGHNVAAGLIETEIREILGSSRR